MQRVYLCVFLKVLHHRAEGLSMCVFKGATPSCRWVYLCVFLKVLHHRAEGLSMCVFKGATPSCRGFFFVCVFLFQYLFVINYK